VNIATTVVLFVEFYTNFGFAAPFVFELKTLTRQTDRQTDRRMSKMRKTAQCGCIYGRMKT